MKFSVFWELNALDELDKIDPVGIDRILSNIARRSEKFDTVKLLAVKG